MPNDFKDAADCMDCAGSRIRIKAATLVHRHRFNLSERDDVEQDMWMFLFGQAGRFDPERAGVTQFVNRVLNTATARLTRGRRCVKRAAGFTAVSLASIPRDTDEFASDAAGKDVGLRLRELGPHAQAELREKVDAVSAVVAALPADLQETCRALMDDPHPRRAARTLRMSAPSMYRRIHRIRRHFDEAGLAEFVARSGRFSHRRDK